LYAKSFHGLTAQAVEPILTCDTPRLAKVTTQFFFISFFFVQFFLFLSSLYAKSFYGLTAQAVEPILTCDTPVDAYSRRVLPFGDKNTVFSHLHPQNPQKPHFGHIQWKAYGKYIFG